MDVVPQHVQFANYGILPLEQCLDLSFHYITLCAIVNVLDVIAKKMQVLRIFVEVYFPAAAAFQKCIDRINDAVQGKHFLELDSQVLRWRFDLQVVEVVADDGDHQVHVHDVDDDWEEDIESLLEACYFLVVRILAEYHLVLNQELIPEIVVFVSFSDGRRRADKLNECESDYDHKENANVRDESEGNVVKVLTRCSGLLAVFEQLNGLDPAAANHQVHRPLSH